MNNRDKRDCTLVVMLAINAFFLASILIAIYSRVRKQSVFVSGKGTQQSLASQVEFQELVPLKLGTQRVIIQFSTFLPQIQLTLISVLQGVALGILIERFVPELADLGLSDIPLVLRGFDSLLIIALVWYLYSAVFLTFLWPFSWRHGLLNFILLAVQGFACYCISRPVHWTIGNALMAGLGALIRILNTRVIDPAAYEREDAYRRDVRGEKEAAWRFSFAFLVFTILGVLQGFWPSPYLEGFIGLGALLMVVYLGLYSEKQDYSWISAYLEGSPWRLRRGLILEKRNNTS